MSKWKRCRTLRKEYEDTISVIHASANGFRHSQGVGVDHYEAPSSTSEACGVDDPEAISALAYEGVIGEDSDGSDGSKGPDGYAEAETSESSDDDSHISSTSQSDPPTGSDSETRDVVCDLVTLACKHNLTHACINDIAGLLRKHGLNVPKDARTIMGTERKACAAQSGTFAHFGLRKGLAESLGSGPVPSELRLQAHVDGMPLYRSSSTGMWPILCRVTNVGDSTPFLVSLYCGEGKPPDVSAFLSPFIDELEELRAVGLRYKGSLIPVVLTAIICDAPARSFVKCSKGHSGYSSCERCNQRGVYVERRMTFPKIDGDLRTDATFRAQADPAHHVDRSPFLKLDIDMVIGFPLEYMHLVCLGVMRRLLHIWVNGNRPHRIGPQQKKILNDALQEAAKSFPGRFQRKPRSTAELDRWKATEFRTFLLYVGPTVLRSILQPREYSHFLFLHVAIRILASKDLCAQHSSYAGELLRYFVHEFAALYGACQMVYNVHSLSHLAGDCARHGPLDNFSAFPFESFLGKLKKKVRSKSKELAQISRRMSEKKPPRSATSSACASDMREGSCYMLQNGTFIMVTRVGGETFDATVFHQMRNFFVVPLHSSKLGIFRTDGASTYLKNQRLSVLRGATDYVRLPFRSGDVFLPFLHL